MISGIHFNVLSVYNKPTEYLKADDFEGDYKPSKDGVAMSLDFQNSKLLFEGLVEILSLAEAKQILETHFKDILDEIYLT